MSKQLVDVNSACGSKTIHGRLHSLDFDFTIQYNLYIFIPHISELFAHILVELHINYGVSPSSS